MKKIITSLMLLLLLCAVFSSRAQNKMLSGKVTDQTHEPLPGVSVKVKNSNIGTTTDRAGNFFYKCLGKRR